MTESATSSRILTIPNLLTIFRMALVPVFVSLLYYQRFFIALLVFVVAGVTDGLDGLFARLFDQRSQLGTVLDPIADKLLMTASFVTLSLPAIIPLGSRHLPVPFWVTAAVISRDIFIIVGAAAINIMTGFRTFRPSWLGKLSTTIQIFGVTFILVAASFPALKGFYLPTVYTIVFAFALFSGIHYVFFVSRLMNEDKRPAAETPK
ncbi:MAG: CDP-alcohol phosphatidyltransferase family protein [Pyrinomonadaceae bacterium]